MQMKSTGTSGGSHPSSTTVVAMVNHSQMQPSWPIVNVQLRNEPVQVRPTSPLLKVPNNNRESLGFGQSKGLLNGPGQNNCFLNCAVQVSVKNAFLGFKIMSQKW